jgi:iron complex transport system substrate-binding protein
MTAGRASFVAELVRLAGGRNIADEIERDYTQVSAEWVIAKDPEIILCLNDSPSAQAPLAAYRQRPGWGSVRAVRTGRVYGGFDTKVMLKPGPRLLQTVALLRTRLARPGIAPATVPHQPSAPGAP